MANGRGPDLSSHAISIPPAPGYDPHVYVQSMRGAKQSLSDFTEADMSVLPSVNLRQCESLQRVQLGRRQCGAREREDTTLERGWGQPGMGWYRDRAILRIDTQVSKRVHVSCI